MVAVYSTLGIYKTLKQNVDKHNIPSVMAQFIAQNRFLAN
jgi:hypothetical protein